MFTTAGYVITLCRLVDSLPNRTGEARQIISQFGRIYRTEIPREHLAKDSSGALVWAKKVQWCRQSAVMLGWMDSPARGIWRVTNKGHEWLATNPNATRIPRIQNSRGTQKEFTPRAVRHHRITRDAYHEFFKEIEARVPELLPDAIYQEPHHFQARANFWQMIFDEFGGCHYQITLRRDYHEIALHFESSRQASHARLNAFEPHVEELSSALNEPIYAGTMGPRGSWARVWFARVPEPLNESLASAQAAQLTRFITATFPILQKTSRARATRKGERGNASESVGFDNPAYHLLDREIESLRAFLEGRSDHRPSDEKICDWIQFCYLFELYAEGRDLYKLISADGVNVWYLERTRKLAKICALRAA